MREERPPSTIVVTQQNSESLVKYYWCTNFSKCETNFHVLHIVYCKMFLLLCIISYLILIMITRTYILLCESSRFTIRHLYYYQQNFFISFFFCCYVDKKMFKPLLSSCSLAAIAVKFMHMMITTSSNNNENISLLSRVNEKEKKN
jgi:hypothetical protein